jgi:hypothetical protein
MIKSGQIGVGASGPSWFAVRDHPPSPYYSGSLTCPIHRFLFLLTIRTLATSWLGFIPSRNVAQGPERFDQLVRQRFACGKASAAEMSVLSTLAHSFLHVHRNVNQILCCAPQSLLAQLRLSQPRPTGSSRNACNFIFTHFVEFRSLSCTCLCRLSYFSFSFTFRLLTNISRSSHPSGACLSGGTTAVLSCVDRPVASGRI